MAWKGGFVVAVPPQYTSQTCPCCGHVSKDNRKTQAKFECVECGFAENADVVGAINILAAGHAVIACGEMVQWGRSKKQEPAEATQAARLSAVGISGLQAGEDVKSGRLSSRRGAR